MADTYTTKSGDMWDAVAHKVYGSESYTGFLMQNNFPQLDYFVFPAGVVLSTPELTEAEKESSALPSWRC